MAARAGTAKSPPRRMAGASTPMHLSNDYSESARLNSGVTGWVNEKNTLNATVVLTDAELVYNLRYGERVLVDQIHYGLNTVEDTAAIELGFTSLADGAGGFTPLTARRHIATGGAIAGFSDQHEWFVVPFNVEYSAGARSITFRVTTNDAGATVTLEWAGRIERVST